MLLRKQRLLIAGVLAVVATLAAPARSEAATQILVEEIDAAGNSLGIATFTPPVGPNAGFFTTQHFTQITVGASSNSSLSTNTASIATGISALNTTAIDPTNVEGYALRVVVTDTFTRPSGSSTTVTSTAGAGNGSRNIEGTNTVTNQTAILPVPYTPGTPPLAVTDVATGISAAGVSTTTSQTANISSLPDTFQIQQTIVMRITSNGSTVPLGQAYSAAVGSATTPEIAAVPAPAGVVLALTALPVLGLRRVLRRKSAV